MFIITSSSLDDHNHILETKCESHCLKAIMFNTLEQFRGRYKAHVEILSPAIVAIMVTNSCC
eukprot:m.233995 g.233995  ORF g.233995 m.233995 type:complete len:62 (+) comp16030_c0_seq30:305-490(+)